MRVVILPTEKEASDFAADFIEKFITEKMIQFLDWPQEVQFY